MTKDQALLDARHTPPVCIVRVPPWIWFLLPLLLGFVLNRFAPLAFLPPSADFVVGWVVMGLGMAVLAWSERAFASHETSHDHRNVASALITTGPFRFSRNPVYIGLFVLLAGTAMTLNSLWILLLAPLSLVVMQFHVIPKEEACLDQLFPNDYPEYRRSVRRWL